MKRDYSFLFFYAAIIFFIGIWWFQAFSTKQPVEKMPISPLLVEGKSEKEDLFLQLSPFSRTLIQSGLEGNASLMSQLISEWDLDAQILQTKGIAGIQRLSSTSYLESQILGRTLRKKKKEEKTRKLIPQTFIAASFLFALVDPKEILAVPKGLKAIPQLFPAEKLQTIPLVIENLHAEQFYQLRPDFVFIAPYSHPPCVQVLEKMGIPLICGKDISCLEDVKNNLIHIGRVIDKQKEADLLKIFMDAALIAIDNRCLALKSLMKTDNSTFSLLYLHYHTHFTTPTGKTIVGQLLKRFSRHIKILGEENLDNNAEWSIQITQEQLAHLQPDCLLISTNNPAYVQNKLFSNQMMASLPAVKYGRLFFLDNVIQEFASQYAVLAYYDLFETLLKL